jgi:TPR repeat protein
MLSRHRWIFSLVSLLACRRTGESVPDASGRAIDVAAVVAACKTSEDCDRECSAGIPASCVAAGRLYEYGHGVPVDPSRAFRLYEQACAQGYAGGCYNAAILLEYGRGVSKNLARARELYTNVCNAGGSSACDRAAAIRPDGGG